MAHSEISAKFVHMKSKSNPPRSSYQAALRLGKARWHSRGQRHSHTMDAQNQLGDLATFIDPLKLVLFHLGHDLELFYLVPRLWFLLWSRMHLSFSPVHLLFSYLGVLWLGEVSSYCLPLCLSYTFCSSSISFSESLQFCNFKTLQVFLFESMWYKLLIIKDECDKNIMWGPTSGCSHVMELMRIKGPFDQKTSPLVACHRIWKCKFSCPEGLCWNTNIFSRRYTYKLIVINLLEGVSDSMS